MDCIKCGITLVEGAIYCHMCGKKQIAEPRKHRKRSNNTGTIYKLPGNRANPWQARLNNVHIGTFPTRAEAQKALDRLVDTDITDKYNLTFAEIYELWLPEHSRTITKSAVQSYKSSFNNCKELHGKKFRTLRHSDFQKVILRMEGDGYSKSMCEKMLQLFGQLSEWAIREEITQVNHARYVTIVAKQKTTGQVFTTEDIEAIKKSQLPAADIALVLLATGCRPNELFEATRDNCFPEYFVGGSKTESGRNRIIAVAPLGMAAYTKLLNASAGQEKLIDGYDGNKNFSNFGKRDFKKLMAEIGREGYTAYDCRHTFITTATRNGVDPQLLRRMVGHANLATTDKYYTHLDADDILNAIKSV